ncbi:MAG: DnaD domain protein, partial [Clostridia bacterium]|nr:DnaD domain protein [Clostridia bacterium]
AAIEAACQEMTRGDPNFAYLDAILKGLMERRGKAAETGDEVTRQLTDEKQENEQIKEMLSAFGLSSKLTDTVKAEYAEMRRYQPHEVIVLAAGIVSKRKSRSLDEVTALARSWSEKGLHDLPSVRAYLHALSEQNALLRALLEASGADPRPTAPGRELLQKWTEEWRFSREVLLLAAGYAQNAQKPLPFMDKMLEGWHNAGVQTVENAVAERERHAQSAPPSSSASSAASPRPMKTVREQQYDQREYDPAEFDGLTPEELKEIEQYEP